MASGSALKFVSAYKLCPIESELCQLVEQIDQCNSDPVYKKLIDEIIKRYIEHRGTAQSVFIRNVAISCFSKTGSRRNIRNYIYEKFTRTAMEENVFLFEDVMNSLTNEVQENINNLNTFNIGQCFNILCFLGCYIHCLVNKEEVVYCILRVLPFYTIILEVFSSHLFNVDFERDDVKGKSILDYHDCYSILDVTLGQLGTTLPRAQYVVDIKNYAVKMVTLCHEVLLCYERLNFQTISKASVILSYFALHLPPEERIFLKHKNYPVLDFLDNAENKFHLVLRRKTLKNIYDNDLMRLVLNLSIYTSVTTQELLTMNYQGKVLLVHLFSNLYDFSRRMSGYTDRMQPISNTMMTLSRSIHQLDCYMELYGKALAFCWANLEYNFEVVVKNTRQMVRIVVNEAGRHYVNGNEEPLRIFFVGLNSQSIYSKTYLNALLSASSVIHCDVVLAYCRAVHHHLLTLITTTSDHDLAKEIYLNMMAFYLSFGTEEQIIAVFLRPVLNVLRRHGQIRHHRILEDIVVHAFEKKPLIFRKLFNPKTVGTARECVIILRCVHLARAKETKLPLEPDGKPEEFWRNLLAKGRMELFMVHQDDEIRVNTLQVITDSQKSTEEFTEWELQYLARYFQMNVAPQSAASRSRICNYYKKILRRHQDTYTPVNRKLQTAKNRLQRTAEGEQDIAERKEAQETIDRFQPMATYYEDFFKHMMSLLLMYLSPDANYSRRSTCLELLVHVNQLIDAEEWQSMFDEDSINCLKHIIHDNYESNKKMAVALLQTLPPESIGFDTEANTRSYYNLGMHMACDIRPSQSLSASYMFQLVLLSNHSFRDFDARQRHVANNQTQPLMLLAMTQRLESMYRESNQNIVEASRTTPFYGLLLSCRSLLRNRDARFDIDAYAFIFNQLANICLAMKNHIMPVVCNTSPEGHLPETSDESDDSFLESEQACKSQKVLVYSWKTMKEIMLLLAELTNQTITMENVKELLPEDTMINICEFFLEVFITTKHRGVFEQAHAAFSTICRSFIHSKYESLNKLPKKWLIHGIGLCTGATRDVRICSTRRSAGLPFLILSILPVLAEVHREFIRRAVDPLLLKARESEQDEVRIHCLNVLRFLFKNSKLTPHLTRLIDRGTIAALDGFKSKEWGVRNAATLLLSTLITKIFGAPNKIPPDSDQEETRVTTGAFAINHKVLFEFMLMTLEEECQNIHSLILHPVLLILSRLYPSFHQNINEKVQRYIRCINVCIRNPTYRTRDLAARASVSLISQHLLTRQLAVNFDRISKKYITDTECHGLLLQIAHIFNTAVIERLPITEYLEKTKHLLSEAGLNYSHMTVTLYMDVLFIMLSRYRDYHDIGVLKDIVVLLDQQVPRGVVTTSRTSFNYSRFQLFMCIIITKFEHVEETFLFLSDMIVSCLYSTDYEMKKKILQLLIYLNQEFSEDQYREHPLLISGDIEICPQIKALVHSFDFKSKKELLIYTHPFILRYFCAEINAQMILERDYYVLTFLLMRFYPCFFKTLNFDIKQGVLDWFMLTARMRNEELTSALISAMMVFLLSLTAQELRELDFRSMILLLIDSAAPSAADFRRLTVAQFLVGSQVLFKKKVFNEYDRYNLLNIIMVLLEDDEPLVRNTMSAFPTKQNRISTMKNLWPVVPNKARNTLALTTTYGFQNDVAICCLASWALRRLPEISRDNSEVYERSELNTYAENIPVTHATSRGLHSVLWNVGNALNYKDRSLFVEEQTLLVTTIVLNSLLKTPSPMVDRRTKRIAICVLKSIAKFVEDTVISNNFRPIFQRHFRTHIMPFIKNKLETDYVSMKAFLTYLYNPLLEIHRQFP